VAGVQAQEGVDVLEIGVPVADPLLDGPIVRDSMARALRAGVTTRRAAELIAALRARMPEQAIVWMSYPSALSDEWPAAVLASGADGVLLPDRAARHAQLAARLERDDVAFAHFLAAPLAEEDAEAAVAARGYVMVQARSGPTGPGEPAPGLADELRGLRARGVRAPLAVGFGVRAPEDARRVAQLGADAVIVGSAMVEAALEGEDHLRAYVRAMREAIDAA
jgi:tryptophan synthase alpha chain